MKPVIKVYLLVMLPAILGAASGANGTANLAAVSPFSVAKIDVAIGKDDDIAGINSAGDVILSSLLVEASQSPSKPEPVMPTCDVYLYQGGKIHDLGNLGGQRSEVLGINDNEQVVGASDTAPWPPNAMPWQGPSEHAFLYDNGKMHDLGSLGGDNSSAMSINAAGQITGSADTKDGDSHAFLYNNGRMQDLGVLNGHDSEGLYINRAGLVAGVSDFDPAVQASEVQEAHQHAFLYRDGKMQDIGTFGGINSRPTGLNAAGDVVGLADVTIRKVSPGNVDLTQHAFLYHDGKIKDLGTLGGKNSTAAAINDAGQIVGTANVSATSRHAFLYSNGKMQDLGALNAKNSGATAINNSGQIVGEFGDGLDYTSMRAFLYDKGRMQDLNAVVGQDALTKAGLKVLLNAQGINDRGQIYGMALDVDGKKVGFLLSPATSSPFLLP